MFVLFVFLIQISYARPCNNYQKDKAEYIASRYAKKIVNEKYDGGNNISVEVLSCNYNSYVNSYNLKIEIHWEGVIFSSHLYEVDGKLSFDENGNNAEFTVTWLNDRLRRYINNRNIFYGTIGTIIILDKLTQE